VFLSLADGDKPAGLVVAKRLRELGLGIAATSGTAAYLARFDQPVDLVVGKVSEGAELTAVDLIADGKVSFVINTPQGRGGRTDGEQIRKSANSNRVSSVTTDRRGARRGAGHGRAAGHRDRRAQPPELSREAMSDERRSACVREPAHASVRARTQVSVGRVVLPSPVMLASGTAGHGAELAPYMDLSELGAVVVKSLAPYEWAGNPAPRLHPRERG
jgi:hypothetical protein